MHISVDKCNNQPETLFSRMSEPGLLTRFSVSERDEIQVNFQATVGIEAN